MPLPKRTIEPVYIARSVYPTKELPQELETVTNTTLTNIVRQLSSLSKHSEDLFGELGKEANRLADRANSLQARIDRLSIKVTQLDSTVEEMSLTEIPLKKAFKSTLMFDQQIFSRSTMPTAMLETYQLCDQPPPLDKLNCYRDDGKDGLKFYTDPNYFFELWRQEMLKDTDKIQKDKRHHRNKTSQHPGSAPGKHRKQKPRQPHNTVIQHQQAAIQRGEAIMPTNLVYITPTMMQENQYDYGVNQRPNSIEVFSGYQREMVDAANYNASANYNEHNYGSAGYAHVDQSAQFSAMAQSPPENPYAPGTPTRRPSQPPPAPPMINPNELNAGTPTRRYMSNGREQLPPPPPVPMETGPNMASHNGTPLANIKMVGSSHQGLLQHYDPRATHQFENEVNTINNQMNDLPPPPPIPSQMSPKMSPQNNDIPPPPPPLPPTEDLTSSLNDEIKRLNGVPNGNLLNKQQVQSNQPQTVKKPITPYQDDTRSDLMKAIRDGITLRKVEREHKEAREVKPPLDVASILARRVAIELSSESSDSDEDDEEWNEQSNANETSA